MKTTEKYEITKKTYPNKSWMWDAKAEIFLSLFAERICQINPKHNYTKVTKEIIEKYLRKRNDSIVGATQIMRHTLNRK